MLEVNEEIKIPESELAFSYARSSGPGGQGVNKVNSKAVLRWDFGMSPSVPQGVKERFREAFGSRLTNAGELLLTSEEFRDQRRNQEACREKLRQMLLSVARPPKRRRPTRPTRGSVERRKESKRRTGEKKQGRSRVKLD